MVRVLTSFGLGIVVACVAGGTLVWAASPSGDDYFQLLTNVTTGGDNTGDGGTGDPNDFNYYYVGQSFTTTMQIVTGGASAANIWIDYATGTVSASGLNTGSFFDTWSGQTINTNEPTSFGGGRVLSTGFNVGGGSSNGTGNFGTVTWTANQPTNASYGVGSPTQLDINIGTIGNTTESNISLLGADILDDTEDFQFHVWADTIPPFAESFSPVDGATGVSVNSNVTFNLRDTRNGVGDLTGVGTGVDTSEPPGVITINAISETDDSSFSCSGTWGSNLCAVTVNPDPPSGISGDPRNFEYNTTYTVVVSGFQDFASNDQDALGDPNGPNTMVATTTTFTTEGDTVAPEVVSESPTRSSTGNAIDTNIVVTVEDRESYPSGLSGVGLAASTCRIDVSSPSVPLQTYQLGSVEVAVASTSYGAQFTINPPTDFAENETVSVSVYGCQDFIGNTMVTDNYTFGTVDGSTPYVDNLDPADDGTVAATGTISFNIKDDGVGVNLGETVIYVNGTYYTNGGGAGQVTTVDTRITFADSLDFNGGNYAGDTTSRSGTSADYAFVIDPETDFTPGEAIPVLIYAEDTNGNLMEREVVGIVAVTDGSSFCGASTTWGGTSCISSVVGSSFCGASTTWDGASCIGIAGAVSGSSFCGTNTTWNGALCIADATSSEGGGTGNRGSIEFSGLAYPEALVYVLEDGVVIARTEADANARFSVEVDDFRKGEYNLSLFAEDTDGRFSITLEYLFALNIHDDIEITDIYLPPTIVLEPQVSERGEIITMSGQSVPGSYIAVGITDDGETFKFTTTRADGRFTYELDSAEFALGEYQARALSASNGQSSSFTERIPFVIEESVIIVEEGYVTCTECPLEIIEVPVTQPATSSPFTVLLRNYQEVYAGDYYLEFIELGPVPIERYEVIELPKQEKPDELDAWLPAVSPYRLEDQALESVVFVRGYAENSDVYVVQLDLSLYEPAERAWYELPEPGLSNYVRYVPFDLLSLLILISLAWLLQRWIQARRKKL